jgi:DNA mismatch repair ATPase MutS
MDSMPAFFKDMNLDQIVKEVLDGKEDYHLEPFFYQSLRSVSDVNYRLQVMKELEGTELFNKISAFANNNKSVRVYLNNSRRAHNAYQRQKWHLDAAYLYCCSVRELMSFLSDTQLESEGLLLFRDWLSEYVHAEDFQLLNTEAMERIKEFESVRYSLLVEPDRIRIKADDSGEDYCSQLKKAFEPIIRLPDDQPIQYFTGFEMCMLENRILEMVLKMNEEAFRRLEQFAERHSIFLDSAISRFEREIQFYLSYVEYIQKLRAAGCSFAYPVLSGQKQLNVTEGYDLALAYKSLESGSRVIPNDFRLNSSERIFILTGPNQGGKTTFSRAFGQIFFLASIGCPVPCRAARLFLFDRIFTHFAAEECLDNKAGRLKEDLMRLKQILQDITPDSVIIINEIFSSTTSLDAYHMGKRVLEHFISLDCICLYVTHIHELAKISEKTVSLMAAVDPGKEAARTYRILRKPADGCSYANTIAEKYSLTYTKLKERIQI